jgi:hypothetical protein
MSKGYKDPDLERLEELSSLSKQSYVSFTNSRKVSMKLKAIPPYLVQMAYEALPKPETPSYTVAIEGGGTETHIHDETSIAQSSDAEKAKWNEYKIILKQNEMKAQEMILNIILIEGVEISSDEERKFSGRLKLMGISLPEDPDERELSFKRAYALGTPEDAEFITRTVMKLTGISQEDLTSLKNSFPG